MMKNSESAENMSTSELPPAHSNEPGVVACLLPGDKVPDFTAVAVDGNKTTLFTFSTITTEYVALLYFPKLGAMEVAELLALKKHLQRFREVRKHINSVKNAF
jgi:peroxiredoxin